ncbi:MAG: ATP-binding cassette domain-containing protein, partial [Holophagales bacterium]|nr:ATP-binding cassette domain-containing protein [Holophagales bacterium]
YGRLREACQTEIDGTSIDTIEEVAVELGLDALQGMVPVDHLLCAEAGLLPALVVARQPDGMTHFVVAWRRLGPLVQVMDPASGRQWIETRRLRDELYVHAMPVPAAVWRGWAGSDGLKRPLTAKLRSLGLRRADIGPLFTRAEEDPGWHTFAALDAAARMIDSLVEARGVRRGRAARRLMLATFERLIGGSQADQCVPDAYWSVRPAPAAEDGTPRLEIRGAVLVQVRGRRRVGGDKAAGETTETLSPELEAARADASPGPAWELWRLARREGLLLPSTLVAALAVASCGVLVEALLFRSLFGLAGQLDPTQRMVAAGLVIAFLGAMLGVFGPVLAAQIRFGRRLELRLRRALCAKLPNLPDRYLRSRPISDMAERGHTLHQVRRLPLLISEALRLAFEIVSTAAGLVWLDPSIAPWAIGAAAFGLAWPLVTQPVLAERDLRVQTHAGASSRFFLDAWSGVASIRAHGAERAVRRAHEALLVAWNHAVSRLQRSVVGIEGVHQAVGFALAFGMLSRHIEQDGPGATLLLVYWALHLPVSSQAFSLQLRQLPALRNKTLRLLEPLAAPSSSDAEPEGKERVPSEADASAGALHRPIAPGVTLELAGVRMRAGGHLILDGIDLSVPAGQHVAVVGRSGAGKSSLAATLLGWNRPSEGTVRVDGELLTGACLERLRSETAWVDPAVQLWNRSFLDNLTFSCTSPWPEAEPGLGNVLREADLQDVVRTLPDGMRTQLGEGGGRLSGGEGQRLRLGRALLQTDPRLVLLDEPFRGLDRDRRRSLLTAARRRWRAATLLCITHDVAETRDFDRVLVVEEGRIVEDGTPGDLIDRPSRYRGMIARDTEVRHHLRRDPRWRRLRLAEQRLIEATEPDPPPAALPECPSVGRLAEVQA